MDLAVFIALQSLPFVLIGLFGVLLWSAEKRRRRLRGEGFLTSTLDFFSQLWP